MHDSTTEVPDHLRLVDGWTIDRLGHDPEQVVTSGTNQMVGNGRLGYRGTFAEWGSEGFVGCFVADTYDTADGKWRELVNAPNALQVRWFDGDTPLGVRADEPVDGRSLQQRLDLRRAVTTRTWEGGSVRLVEQRFASMADTHCVVQRHELEARPGTALTVELAIDGDVWDLNAMHLPDLAAMEVAGVAVVHGTTVESQVHVAVGQAWSLDGGDVTDATTATVSTTEDVAVADHAEVEVSATATTAARRGVQRMVRRVDVEVGGEGRLVLDLVMAVGSSNDSHLPDERVEVARAVGRLAADAGERGWDALLADHEAEWAAIWDRSDVVVEAVSGDLLAQLATRFGILHNVIATPRHADHLPIGARGLSCQAYQGAAFWDQEVFNLPMFLFTEPAVARNQLAYRVATLDGARRKAARLGYEGAFFAWISGDTGDELCPDFFFRDVLTGRWIRNHFNDWQVHVAPDVSLTVRRYVETTGDVAFLADGGAEIAVEVARFLRSFVYRDHRGRHHCVRLLGPDEFHENVDDNAFTNHQVEQALRWGERALVLLEAADAPAAAALIERLGVTREERLAWVEVADTLVLPVAGDDGVIEAFTGFFNLEDTTPEQLEERLQDPDEYWGWPNGVAVHTQVAKQADVVQLFVCQPGRFDAATMAANVDHYLPRSAHKSSLSPSAYAMVLAWIDRADEALALFLESATVDLLSTTNAAPGGTFIGGLRTAAAAASWNAAVLGFGGLRVDGTHVHVAPHLPTAWSRLAFGVQVHGTTLHVEATHAGTDVTVVERGQTELTVETTP